ncbi:hypothetical protein RND81_02G194600 [Saponaria officinalis]|uniref:BHLH domain-containing protein n=1 Tax=Saponaria officinalis TaxID=3572 RepID=A0AAW1MV40_SAPOF
MEDFSGEFHKVLEPTGSFSDLNNLSDHLNQPLCSNVLDYFSTDPFLSHPNIPHPPVQVPQLYSFDQVNNSEFCIQKHEKNVTEMTEFAGLDSSPGLGTESGGVYRADKINGTNEKKRKRKSEGKGDKLKEVIHVRAKRGQATDSHSLAERVRRERINEKLKVLQDLVPGCYKTMAMAAMLDVIINYVRSLQNQIEVSEKKRKFIKRKQFFLTVTLMLLFSVPFNEAFGRKSGV